MSIHKLWTWFQKPAAPVSASPLKNLSEPKYETRDGGVLVMTWDADTFAGIPIAVLEAGGPEKLDAHQVSDPGVNLKSVNAWWAANRARVRSHFSEGVIEHRKVGTIKF